MESRQSQTPPPESEKDPRMANDREVGFIQGSRAPSESQLTQGLDRSIEMAARIAARRKELVDKLGKPAWVLPWFRGSDRPQFESEESAWSYLKKHAPARLEQAQLSGEPIDNYAPQKIIVEPKLTAEDLNPDTTPEQIDAAREASRLVQDAVNHSTTRRSREDAQVTKLIHGGFDTVNQIPTLADDVIQRLGTQAWQMGKSDLSRHCYRELVKRGVEPRWR